MGKYTTRLTEEQERAILSLYFTNPFGSVSFIIPGRGFGPEEQASLAAQFSRNPAPYQQKFLALLERDIDMEFVNALVANPALAHENQLLGRRARAESERFHAKWSLGVMDDAWKDSNIRGYGDGSIKDAANLLYHIEGLPEIHTKVVTEQPTNRPQVASTRYIEWTDWISAAERNADILDSPYSSEILSLTRTFADAYNRFTDIGERFIAEHQLNTAFRDQHWMRAEAIDAAVQKTASQLHRKDPSRTFSETDFDDMRKAELAKREKDWTKYARKTVLDFTRSLLLPSIPTYMAVATDDTTLERDVTAMLSHPLRVVRELGDAVKAEAAKIVPTLMGTYTHAQRDEHQIELREALTRLTKTLPMEVAREYHDPGRVHFNDAVDSYTDAQMAAAVVYPYSHASLDQLYRHFADNPSDVRRVVDTILSVRRNHDPRGFRRDPDELMHGGHLKETLINWGADRDLLRHRRQVKTRQLLSMHHGYETPELITTMGLKEEFDELMARAKSVFLLVETNNPHTAQYAVPFAGKVRRLYSSQFGQDLFMTKLRSAEGGHIAYRTVAWDYERLNRRRMPHFSDLHRVDHDIFPEHLINLSEARKWFNDLSVEERAQYEYER